MNDLNVLNGIVPELTQKQRFPYNLFGSANDINDHNNSYNSDLDSENVGVNFTGWIRLYTAVVIGATIYDFWRFFVAGKVRIIQSGILRI